MTTVARGADGLWGWSREQWDPARRLVANPPGGYAELGPFAGTHLIGETAWFALDALAHREVVLAVEALTTVLGRQYDRPGRPWHGTFPHASGGLDIEETASGPRIVAGDRGEAVTITITVDAD